MSESMLDNWNGEKNLEVKEANIGFEHRSTRFRLNITTTRTTARLWTYRAYNFIQINFNGHVPPARWVGRASSAGPYGSA